MGPNPTPEAHSGKLKEVERLLAAIQGAEAQGRWIRRLLLLAIVVFLATFTFLFYKRGSDFVSEPSLEKLNKAALKSLKDSGTDEKLMAEVKALATNVREPVTKAFNDQFKKDSKRLGDKFNSEMDILLKESLPKKIPDQVKKHYHKVLMENQGIFEEEFPELLKNAKEREDLAGHVANALSKLSSDIYADKVNQESERLLETWKSFPPAAQKNTEELEEEMIDLLLQLFWYQIGDLAPPAPKTAPSAPKK